MAHHCCDVKPARHNGVMNAFADAIQFAQSHEVPWPRDPHAAPLPGQVPFGVHHGDPAPWNVLRGPVHMRGGVSGVVLQRGVEVAAWGAPDRADQTFSVAKTYLALLAGVANARGLLPDVDEPVVARVPGIGFDCARNSIIARVQPRVPAWMRSDKRRGRTQRRCPCSTRRRRRCTEWPRC